MRRFGTAGSGVQVLKAVAEIASAPEERGMRNCAHPGTPPQRPRPAQSSTSPSSLPPSEHARPSTTTRAVRTRGSTCRRRGRGREWLGRRGWGGGRRGRRGSCGGLVKAVGWMWGGRTRGSCRPRGRFPSRNGKRMREERGRWTNQVRRAGLGIARMETTCFHSVVQLFRRSSVAPKRFVPLRSSISDRKSVV